MLTPYNWFVVSIYSLGITLWFFVGIYLGCKLIDPFLGYIIFPKDKK